jgi:hypothetical protein
VLRRPNSWRVPRRRDATGTCESASLFLSVGPFVVHPAPRAPGPQKPLCCFKRRPPPPPPPFPSPFLSPSFSFSDPLSRRSTGILTHLASPGGSPGGSLGASEPCGGSPPRGWAWCRRRWQVGVREPVVSIVPLPLGVVAAETRRRAHTRDPVTQV